MMPSMSVWPHIWAIPLVFFAGAVAGWLLRGARLDRHPDTPPRRSPPPELD